MPLFKDQHQSNQNGFSFNQSFLLCLAIPEPKGAGPGFLSRQAGQEETANGRYENRLDGGRDWKRQRLRERELSEEAAARTDS